MGNCEGFAPKFEDQKVGMRLAFLGSINDDIIIRSELALQLIEFLNENYPDAMKERYGIEIKEKPVDTLAEIAKARMCYAKGEEPDYDKASGILIDDFRSGRLGRITLE